MDEKHLKEIPVAVKRRRIVTLTGPDLRKLDPARTTRNDHCSWNGGEHGTNERTSVAEGVNANLDLLAGDEAI
jgi:hypothetical protein